MQVTHGEMQMQMQAAPPVMGSKHRYENYKIVQCRDHRVTASLFPLPINMATNGCISSSINLSNSLGSTLAGVFLSLVFYGVSILQTYVARAFYGPTLDHFLFM